MKKRAALLCAAALALAALTGCSGREPERTAEEWTDLYVQAITNHGGEMVEYNPVISRFDPEDGASALALESLGLAEEDMEAFGASVSVMNTQAYAIAAVRPVQGKTDAVRKALQGYVDRQQSSFELYLPDQYQVAQGARLETLEDGTVLLNIQQIYRTFLSGLSAKYPLIGSLIPDWTLGDYITQDQLAVLMGSQPAVSEMENYSVSAFSPSDLQQVHPQDGIEGYLYFTPRQSLGDAEVVIGFPIQSLWTEFFRCQILVDLPAQGLHLELTGKALPGTYDIQLPDSVMQDDDINALSEIIQAVRSIAQLVGQMVG